MGEGARAAVGALRCDEATRNRRGDEVASSSVGEALNVLQDGEAYQISGALCDERCAQRVDGGVGHNETKFEIGGGARPAQAEARERSVEATIIQRYRVRDCVEGVLVNINLEGVGQMNR